MSLVNALQVATEENACFYCHLSFLEVLGYHVELEKGSEASVDVFNGRSDFTVRKATDDEAWRHYSRP